MKKIINDSRTGIEFGGFSDLLSVLAIILILIIGFLILNFQQEREELFEVFSYDKEEKKDIIKTLYEEIDSLNTRVKDLEKKDQKKVIVLKDLDNKLLFKSAQADINEAYKRDLDDILKEINTFLEDTTFNFVQITGHTDRVGINRNCFKDNWDLGAARALAVVKYFTNSSRKNPISNRQIEAISRGEFHPVDDRNNELAYTKNRRIEITLLKR